MKFKKGESGNPNGRPKKKLALTTILWDELQKARHVNDEGEQISAKEAVAQKLIKLGLEGEDLGALKYIFDRIDGRPEQSLQAEIESHNESVSEIKITFMGNQEDDDE